MALPQDGQDANGLTKVTQIPAGKELMFIDPTTNEGGIITLEDLTKQILNGLLSQTFALDAGQKTIIQALNTLNSPRPGEHGILRTMYVDGSQYAIQEFLSLASAQLLIRVRDSNGWRKWVEK